MTRANAGLREVVRTNLVAKVAIRTGRPGIPIRLMTERAKVKRAKVGHPKVKVKEKEKEKEVKEKERAEKAKEKDVVVKVTTTTTSQPVTGSVMTRTTNGRTTASTMTGTRGTTKK